MTEQPTLSIPISPRDYMSRSELKKLRRFMHYCRPQMKPYRIQGTPKVAWRIRKKWFNRFYKPRLIGTMTGFRGANGEYEVHGEITSVRLYREGRGSYGIDFTLQPTNNQ